MFDVDTDEVVEEEEGALTADEEEGALTAEEEEVVEGAEAGETVEELKARLDKLESSSHHWHDEYMREKRKRQALQQAPPTETAPKRRSLDEVKTIQDYHELNQAETAERIQQEVDRRLKEQLARRIERSQDKARKRHDGSDEKPTYDDVMVKVIQPLIKEDPTYFYEFAEESDPAEAAYQYGLERLDGTPAPKRKTEKAGGKVIEKIKEIENKARTSTKGSARPHRSTKQTAEDIMNMSKDDFEKEISKVTGRIY